MVEYRIPRYVRVLGSSVLLVGSIAASLGLVNLADANNVEVDVGIRSAFAAISSEPGDAFLAQVTLHAAAPDESDRPRIVVSATAGEASEAPLESIAESVSSAPRGARVEGAGGAKILPLEVEGGDAAETHAGFSVVLGGELSKALSTCEGTTTEIASGLEFADLTEIEQSAVIANLGEQERDRSVVFGEPADSSEDKSSLEYASSMTYSVLSSTLAWRWAWTMQPAPSGEPSSATPPEPTTEPETVRYLGHYAWFDCALAPGSLSVDQPWGQRVEFPAITSAAALRQDGANFHVRSEYTFFRPKWTPGFQLRSTYPSDGVTSAENWSGRYGATVDGDYWTPEFVPIASSHVEQTAIAYRHASSSQFRELLIFLAGVAVSFAVSMLIILATHVAPIIPRLADFFRTRFRRLRHSPRD